ncbi:HD domain-containing protein [Oceanotoga sp. DSM 15011]|uniref:HD domain-containing phosphohydrolase n=1 Tax=Oceanotoga sp. DSM 15011 TaxID=2984951 RepID=UPI0021F449BB|nr:HD domain-containing phosphohydrolase [Oceanotoga sp. DSM 15011]UYP00396.1 HD domain-containing protein [Oceanotoga sp. DSM 15011]
MKKIKDKILNPIIYIYTTSFFIIFIIITLSYSINLKKSTTEKINYLSNQIVNDINNINYDIEKSVYILKDYILSTINIQRLKTEKDTYLEQYLDEINTFFFKVANSTQNNDSVYIFFNPELSNEAYDIYYKIENNDYKLQERLNKDDYYNESTNLDWFYIPKYSKEKYWSIPYDWKNINYISMTLPIYDQDTFIGIVGIDLLTKNFLEYLKKYLIFNKNTLYLYNENGYIINNQNIKLVQENKTQYTTFINSDLSYVFNKKLNNDWNLIIYISYNDLYKNLFITSLFSILLFIISLILINKYVSNKVNTSIKSINELKNKINLFEKPNNIIDSFIINSNDEIELFSKSLDKLLNNLNQKNIELKKKNNIIEAANEQLEAQNIQLEELYLDLERTNSNLKSIIEIVSKYDNDNIELKNFYDNILDFIKNLNKNIKYNTLYKKSNNKIELLSTNDPRLKKFKNNLFKCIYKTEENSYNILKNKKYIEIIRNLEIKNLDFIEIISKIEEPVYINYFKIEKDTYIIVSLLSKIDDYLQQKEPKMISTSISLIKSFLQNKVLFDNTKKAYYNFSTKLANIAESYDEITGKHIYRVGLISAFIAEKLNKDKKYIEDIKIFAPLHDIGKIFIPHDILDKNGALNDKEWEIMKKHTLLSETLLDDEYFEMARQIALYHHEKYDGKGYPFGIHGKDIPLCAQIVNIADIYDALRSKRPYKEPFTHEKSLKIIQFGDKRISPTNFNPEILETFIKYNNLIKEIYDKHSEK